jgi:nucleotide-binding universal stress UspA family protein
LLLSVVLRDGRPNAESVAAAQQVLGHALCATLDAGHEPEALLTVAPAPWTEIARVAKIHRCAGIVLGSPEVNAKSVEALEEVMSSVDCNVTFLSSKAGWDLEKVERIVVPVGGRGGHSELRARLIGSLHRMAPRKLVWMRVLPESATKTELESARRRLVGMAVHSSPGAPEVIVKRSADFVTAVVEETHPADLVVLGLRRPSAGRRVFGDIALQMASKSPGATLVISSAS